MSKEHKCRICGKKLGKRSVFVWPEYAIETFDRIEVCGECNDNLRMMFVNFHYIIYGASSLASSMEFGNYASGICKSRMKNADSPY